MILKRLKTIFSIALISFTALVFAQDKPVINTSISGRVVNAQTGEALEGANVMIKGITNGAVTDESGRFYLLTAQKMPFAVVASFTGYAQKEIIITDTNLIIRLDPNAEQLGNVVVSSRRRLETAQEVPIAISVISGVKAEEAGAFNVNRLKEMVPSVQLYTSNPRNTGINIRGIGSPFGLTNDGLDPGVGFYVDGVYFARPAAATLDFIDIDRIEVLRGPQGTLFGKNTTAGSFNITTRKPVFKPESNFELSYGNYNFVQAKASVAGPVNKKLAFRASFSGTNRNGLVENIATNKATNSINNFGWRGQLLYKLSEKTSILLAVDNTKQRPDGYAQVVAGVVETRRPAFRQFNNIIADLNYQLPSRNPFDRIIDHDTPWNSDNDLGGVSLNADTKLGPGTLTSTTAYRYWDWGPSNDRDFTGLQALAKSQNPSRHEQWSQELRYAGSFSSGLSGVIGAFVLGQQVKTNGTEESGKDQWRFVQNSTSPLWRTPGLLEGYGIRTQSSIQSLSAALFANLDWEVFKGFHILPGLRYNYDEKDVNYNRVASGGLETTDPELLALKRTVYSSQAYEAYADERNLTYQLTLSYKPNRSLNTFATYSTSFKPVGVNVAGLPTINNNGVTRADSTLAVIKPERVSHFEIGFKSNPTQNLTLNFVFHHTDIENYQANVQSPQLGVNRGYIANAEKVNVKGVELDASLRANDHFSFTGALAYTEAKYVRFTNAPLPLEETGFTENGVQKSFKDISGGQLPGISRWAGSLGAEFVTPSTLWKNKGNFFTSLDVFYRSRFSSSPSPSAFLNIEGYTIVNARVGFRAGKGLSLFVWARNLLDKNYFEQLLPAGGNAGHFAGVLGDQRTYGITLRFGQ